MNRLILKTFVFSLLGLCILVVAGFKLKKKELYGKWVYDSRKGDMYIYKKVDSLKTRGIVFERRGKMHERKNSGWCGTPPISYANYDGSWKVLNDSVVQVSTAYWGGKQSYQMVVKSVTDDTLMFRMENETFEDRSPR
ncbi:hypothetical protein [Aureibacter tunicatorum]|uniref:Lipocalin-like domain-containing protein n=1 Tax=Aureibacter tunicatorum TaxID=866807 RepID=A0AAE3XNC5_9BACT|nr:hypothetical protein [Aureibacter tunicatorum]MDR6238234.1 hypothetical protein [Aureibacter tunicatorum]BDD03267.1 hypothetical protein AUTU_07500 [Aureibacter tunicatorum]